MLVLEMADNIDSDNSLLSDLVSGMEFLQMTRSSGCYADSKMDMASYKETT